MRPPTSRVKRDSSVEAALARLPLAVAEAWLPGRLSFTQQVNGRLELVRSAEGVFSGTAGFDVSAGRVATVDDPEIGLDTALGSVAIELADGRLLSAALDLPFEDGGGIDADFALLNAADPRSSAVQGRATIDVPDIRIGVGLLPSLSRLRGQLQSNWVLQGTADAPDLAGDLRLARGEIGYAPIGLLLTDVALDGKLSPAAGMAVSGSFRAGDGLGRIESSAESVDGIDLYIRGERLALVNLPEVRAVVTPDLELAYADQTLRIGGTLAVPSARIQPADLTGGRVSESDDVVIVAGEVPSIRTARDSDSALRYAGSLTVALGDDVVVDLEPARARLGGEVVYSWNGEAMPTGRGRFTLGGNVAAFGQVLDITDGQIRFNGGPASNPSLRIRAEREIYGNSDVKSAGVLIDGPASNPTIEAYTQPASNEERALTLLVTGSDFDYEQGVGALDFGTYIAPRLFVSYGVGIFDRDNVISARYDLARGFGIKMSSGDKASGVDLSYRFER